MCKVPTISLAFFSRAFPITFVNPKLAEQLHPGAWMASFPMENAWQSHEKGISYTTPEARSMKFLLCFTSHSLAHPTN